ncbi:MAG: 30S ribosomal protein S9 [Patescibacteria group bacterium]
MTAKKPAANKKAVKKPVRKPVVKEEEVLVAQEIPVANGNGKEKYFQAIGRRKESIARIRLYTKKSTDTVEEEKALIVVNGKDYRNYFSDANLWNVVESPLRKLKSLNRFKVTVVVRGGGMSGQAGAIKHGIARALVEFDLNFRKKLKKSGFLTRDSRIKERRKYGHKKARKMGQFSKR